MWDILLSSPGLMGSFVFYMIMIVAVLIYATLTRYGQPSRCDDVPSPQVIYQVFRSYRPRWSRVEPNRHFSPVQDSCSVNSDRPPSPVQYWRSTVYARMFADASERIRF
jgi:hypothetical protein